MNQTEQDLLEIMESGEKFSTHEQVCEAYKEKFSASVPQSAVQRFLKKYGYVKLLFHGYVTKEVAAINTNSSRLSDTFYSSKAKLNEVEFHGYILISNCDGYSERFIDQIKVLAPNAVIIKTETDSLLIFEVEEGDLGLVRKAYEGLEKNE